MNESTDFRVVITNNKRKVKGKLGHVVSRGTNSRFAVCRKCDSFETLRSRFGHLIVNGKLRFADSVFT